MLPFISARSWGHKKSMCDVSQICWLCLSTTVGRWLSWMNHMTCLCKVRLFVPSRAWANLHPLGRILLPLPWPLGDLLVQGIGWNSPRGNSWRMHRCPARTLFFFLFLFLVKSWHDLVTEPERIVDAGWWWRFEQKVITRTKEFGVWNVLPVMPSSCKQLARHRTTSII